MQLILPLLPNTSEDGNKTETLSILRIDLDEETNLKKITTDPILDK